MNEESTSKDKKLFEKFSEQEMLIIEICLMSAAYDKTFLHHLNVYAGLIVSAKPEQKNIKKLIKFILKHTYLSEMKIDE